ncbi:SCO7613 C-terminal domain-containing membrane protein [Streptomyces sp. H27-D2]|uniref:SCO7613 C-terminal domain-containing membrane protein n=1 Tax=Streptomyces sp. H27-D2 TaxID=3046304 RepID=UPI002DBE9EA8|nr:hypothetical protein [Streptomyces sp. H27-D2]MEC4015597.1 hypothetical protein [Streptomyces sp. H27-D2]
MKFATPVEELRHLDHTLARLDADRARLLARRAQLIAMLRAHPAPGARWGPPPRPAQQARRAYAGPPGPAVPPAPPWPGAASAPGPDTSPPSAQNVLLTLGGALLAIAAIAFLLVSWGHLGIGGRAAVLGAVTLAAMGAPVLLLRRALTATAETVACVGLVLLALDAYALHRVALPEADGPGYAAVASAIVAAIWAAYGLTVRELRLPLPAAVGIAQLPLFLWAASVSAGPFGFGTVLLGTAALDTALALRGSNTALRLTAAGGTALTGSFGLLTAVGLSVTTDDPVPAAQAAALLCGSAAVALYAAHWTASRTRSLTLAASPAALAGLALVIAPGGMLRLGLPAGWTVFGYLLCGCALLALAGAGLPRPFPAGLAAAAALVHACALLWTLPTLATAVLGPVGWAGSVWSGAPESARRALGPDFSWTGGTATPVVLAVVAAAVLAASRRPELRTWRVPAERGALVLGCAASATLPVALDLAYPIAVLLLVAVASVLLLATATLRTDPIALTALLCACVVALTAIHWALAEQTMTLIVLGALLATFTGAAVAAQGRVHRSVAACAAVLCGTALAVAGPAALDLPAHHIAFVVLAVVSATALAAARLRAHPTGLPVECAGYPGAALAIGLTASHPATLALALGWCGVLAAGIALRPDRRPAAYAATALFVLAAWVRLAASGVEVPEAYTLPISIPALAIGFLRRRRDPSASSWAAYGPGLAVTLAPSLIAAWGDSHWLRPLLLGLAALAVTLLGARWRLQALLVLGGAALGLDALHELAPYIVQVVGALPRWLPPAVAGLLLLGLGGTSEQRLREARRMRDALGRMR